MQLRKYRWSRHYESAEEELIGLLRAKKIDAKRWTAEAFEPFESQSHGYDKRLWCAEGSIMIHTEGKDYPLQPGDTLDLPANTPHSATTGFTGVVCYEAHSQPR